MSGIPVTANSIGATLAREGLLLHALPSSGALAPCIELVLSEPNVAAQLAALRTSAELLDALRVVAAERGVGFDAEAATRATASGSAPVDCRIAAWPLAMRRGWHPLALEWGPLGAELVWGCGVVDASAAFHELNVGDLQSRPLNRLFSARTPLTPAFVAALTAEALPIAGLIFHMSRCGSTLVAKALGAWPGSRVHSEPGLLDTAIAFTQAGYDRDGTAIHAVLAALAQPGDGAERVFIKLDAWHTLALPRIVAIAGAPWIFVYRDAVEVLASHVREPGRHVVPGLLPPTWGIPQVDDATSASPRDHAAKILGLLCAAVVPHARASNLLNYAELPGALASRLPRLFGLDADAVDHRGLEAILGVHAKRPYETYVDDRAAKQEQADAATYARIGRWIAPHYDALEETRRTLRHLRLPIACDLEALRADLAAVAPAGWHPHFNREYYSGEWSGLALRAQPHGRSPLYADPTRDDFADTAIMRACSYVPTLLAQFHCPIESVRFLKLAPGAEIREHRDYGLRFEDGKLRFHIPVHTNPDVEFVLGGESLRLAAGECWYLNFDLGHALANRGTSDRVHLVIDARVNAWAMQLFESLRAD